MIPNVLNNEIKSFKFYLVWTYILLVLVTCRPRYLVISASDQDLQYLPLVQQFSDTPTGSQIDLFKF